MTQHDENPPFYDDAPARKGNTPGKAITVAEVRRVGAQAAMLLGLARKMPPDELEALGVRPEHLEALQESIEGIEALPAPTAKAMFLAGFSHEVTKELVLTNYHRTILALHACAPVIGYRLMDKVDDYNAPGSTRVLIELAKGLGILQPAEAVSQQKRMALLDLEELRKKPADELRDEILRHS